MKLQVQVQLDSKYMRMAHVTRPKMVSNTCRPRCQALPFAKFTNRSGHTRRPTLFVANTAAQGPSAPSGTEKTKTGAFVYDTVIVGGGISGLVAGQALAAKHGIKNFLITEARDRVGGNITSRERDGYLWEEGPNSFQPSDSVLQIAVDAGCEKDLVFGDPTAPRFVFWEGALRLVPSGLDPTVVINVLSLWGVIRAGLGAVGIKAPAPEYEESVEQFIRRNLGDAVFYRLIEPFCSGVYAGDPAKLSMKAAFGVIYSLEQEGGSLIGGAILRAFKKGKTPAPARDPRLPPKPKGQTVGSFRQGLITLPRAIERNIKDTIKLNWKLTDIERETSSGFYVLTYATPDGDVAVRTRTVATTAPAYVMADLLEKHAPRAAEALRSFDYPPVAAVTLSYPKSAIREDRTAPDGSIPGFGQLHPRTQGVVTLGTIYSSSLFPGRAPDGEILLLNYIGGATNRKIVDMSEEDIVKQVDTDLRKMLLRSSAPPPKVASVKVWPRAIPQYNVGHGTTLETARQALKEAQWTGFELGGNFVSGVALGKCVDYGYSFAKSIATQISQAKTSASVV